MKKYEFVIHQPADKGFTTHICLVNWKPEEIKLGKGRTHTIYGHRKEYIIQWPWQWFYRLMIELVKKKIVVKYEKELADIAAGLDKDKTWTETLEI